MVKCAALLNTGDELVTGQVVDTNAAFLADKLLDLGVEVTTIVTVGDQPQNLLHALDHAFGAADLVIMTGGLGPTSDDLTREVVSEFMAVPLIDNEEERTRIASIFQSRGRVVTPNNLKQAKFPEGVDIMPNSLGTAPGFWVSLDHHGRQKHLAALPGVPREMELMVREALLPRISRLVSGRPVVIQSFKLVGLTESTLDAIVNETISGEQFRISFRANFPDLTLKIRAEGEERRCDLEAASQRIREKLGEYIYAEREVDLEIVVGSLLSGRQLTLAVAESCTGGMVSERLTRVPGSSAFLKLGIVAYSEDSKQNEIGVSPETLTRHGAVSRAVAEEMAQGVRRRADTDFGLAVTGIAGPTGGTEETPIGTVWIGLANRKGVWSKRETFRGERQMVRMLASQTALNHLRLTILEHSL